MGSRATNSKPTVRTKNGIIQINIYALNGRDFLKITFATDNNNNNSNGSEDTDEEDEDVRQEAKGMKKKKKIDIYSISRISKRDSHCKYHGLCLRNVREHMDENDAMLNRLTSPKKKRTNTHSHPKSEKKARDGRKKGAKERDAHLESRRASSQQQKKNGKMQIN